MPVFTAAVMSAGQLELEAQQIRFRSQAPGVANAVSVTAQDAVTGDDDGDGVGAVRGRNRTPLPTRPRFRGGPGCASR
jgi:hypothetical protein